MRIVSSHQGIREYRNHAQFIKLSNYFSLCIDRFYFVIPSLHCFILCRQNNRYKFLKFNKLDIFLCQYHENYTITIRLVNREVREIEI